MTVEDLIIKLSKCDLKANISIWDGYYDNESLEVKVSLMNSGNILIMTHLLGKEI